MRQFFWGVVVASLFWYVYERADPPAILAYLNEVTASAVRSTSGYRDSGR